MADQVDSTSTETAVPSFSAQVELPAAPLLYRFLGLIRFSHTVFALPFAGLACCFALVVPSPIRLSGEALVWRLMGVLLCMVTARSAAMAFNRLVDRQIDAANPRTATRHLPAGALSPVQVWIFFLAMSAAFMLACGLFLPNWLPLAGAIPVLVWICGYSFAKRFTSAAHLWLGVALALSPICAWVAVRGEAVLQQPSDLLPAVWLALAIATWVAGFDIIYACQDAEFDRRQGLNSIPARFGVAGALRLAAGLHSVMLFILAWLPSVCPQLGLGSLYYAGLVGVGGLILWQHWLVKPSDLGRINAAFFQANAMISFGLTTVAALDAWLL